MNSKYSGRYFGSGAHKQALWAPVRIKSKCEFLLFVIHAFLVCTTGVLGTVNADFGSTRETREGRIFSLLSRVGPKTPLSLPITLVVLCVYFGKGFEKNIFDKLFSVQKYFC